MNKMAEERFVEHITLYKGQSFQNCSCTEKTPYSIKHSPQPIVLPEHLIKALEMLLWYAPNNRSSSQSFDNEYIKNQVFEDAVVTYYLRFMKLSSSDICFVPGNKLDQCLVDPFVGEVCHNCQKIIVSQRSTETKLTCLLRHLRNCLAHGRFNLLSDDGFIGFDKEGEVYTAVFKTRIERIYRFCEQLIHYPDFTVSHIIQYILLKNGYTILPIASDGGQHSGCSNYEELVFAIKGNTALRINCSRYRQREEFDLIEIIDEYIIDFDDQFNSNVKYIDLYYCESEEQNLREYPNKKYVFGLACLEMLYEMDKDFSDLIPC